MIILILPDDRTCLPDQIDLLTKQLKAEGHEPSERRRLQLRLTWLISLRTQTIAQRFTPPERDQVRIGTTAVVRCGRKNRQFPIAGVITFTNGRLPCNHPYAVRLLGKRVGDTVEIDEREYEVISIEPSART